MTDLRCLMVKEASESPRIEQTIVSLGDLPAGDVTIRVEYSSLNYKDALACQGHRGVVKSLPHIPGIDAAGTVSESSEPTLPPGTPVLVTGYDLGQGTWGGWCEAIRVPAQWVVRIPSGLSPRTAMAIGTAGFTAAQSVLAIQRNEVQPSDGEILVTGATGGVGSVAVSLLAKLGYHVVAVSRKADQTERLVELGAGRVISTDEISDDSSRPMLSAKWAGAIDTVGGDVLTSILRSTKLGGCVTTCGLVAGADLDMTLYPFLLRGISLCGIASADCPRPRRLQIWDLLSQDWQLDLEAWTNELQFSDVPAAVQSILAGNHIGRTIIKTL